MKIGLVGYQGSGRSTLFHWLTGVPPDPALSHTGQSGMAPIPDPRLQQLADLYHSKKITIANIEIVDTPGLSRKHEGNAARMAMIREADCLVFIVAAFANTDPLADLRSFDEDLLLADMEILAGRIHRVQESLKKPIPRQEHQVLEHELNVLKILLAALESGKALAEIHMTDEQRIVTRAFRLFCEKTRVVIVNTADDEQHPERFTQWSTQAVPVLAIPAGLEVELSKMTPRDRAEFEKEMGLVGTDRDHLIRTLLKYSGQMTFFTAGEKEVRTWLIRNGGTALEAADGIHTDLARGFIRAETVAYDDLQAAGDMKGAKAAGKVRLEGKTYVVKDGDIINFRFNV